MPIPCRKFYKGKTTPQEICEVGIDKIGEEYLEVQTAAFEWLKHENDENCGEFDVACIHLAEELTDLITAATSFLEAIGCYKEDRAELQARVNEKNRRRGYHE